MPLRVIASVKLYRHIARIRSRRQLETALELRVDFKWLVESHKFDHTTISRFRKKFGDQLVDLGVQMAVMAHQMGATSLTTFGFDGTRIRSNNLCQRAVNVEELDQLKSSRRVGIQPTRDVRRSFVVPPAQTQCQINPRDSGVRGAASGGKGELQPPHRTNQEMQQAVANAATQWQVNSHQPNRLLLPVVPVERSIVDRFAQVDRVNFFCVLQVRDRAADAKNLVVSTS